MPIFKRGGEPLTLPAPPAEHQQTLYERKVAAGAALAELQQRIETLTAECRESLLEGRFEDNSEATAALEWSREELVRAETAHKRISAVELEVARERQLHDLRSQLQDAEASQAVLADRCARLCAELPVMVAALQQLAGEALAVEEQLLGVKGSVHVLKHQIQHFDAPSFSVPRLAMSGPVSALFESHPEYRALANGNWFVGIAGPR